MRISVDITKPLKKIIVLEDEKGNKTEDIPMLVYYERLHDFCFCCGRIGHQYYKSESKDELAYGPWLKATTTTEWLKQNRGKDKWGADFIQASTKSPTQASDDLLPITVRDKQWNPVEQEEDEGLNQT